MKKFVFPAVCVALVVLSIVSFPGSKPKDTDTVSYAKKEGAFLLPQDNVAIVVLDLKKTGLSFTKAADILRIDTLQEDFIALPGIVKVESLLNASRIISEGDDIIVSKVIPPDRSLLSNEYLRTLISNLADFPELGPFINAKQDTLLFYLYFGNTVPPEDIYRELKGIKTKWASTIPFEFTGKGPIIAETAARLTDDIALFFPLLLLMVVAVFSLFKSFQVIGLALLLMLMATAIPYGLGRSYGLHDTSLILLIPVFSIGLLSDYLLHFFYHYFHRSEIERPGSLRKKLLLPLSLTALSTIAGFLSLTLLQGSGHAQIGLIIAAAVVLTWLGVFLWLDYFQFSGVISPLMNKVSKGQIRLFTWIARYRIFFFAAVAIGVVWGLLQIGNLSIEPYPIEQLPESSTIQKADRHINEEFYGTLPFFIEVDTGEKMGIMKKEALLKLEEIHSTLESGNTGYAFSVLSVLKRINYYFMGSEDSFLTGNEYDDFFASLIEQYLLYYSSSVDPVDYESLLDNSYRFFSIKGLLYYRSYGDMEHFLSILEEIRSDLPAGWSMELYGTAKSLATEHDLLARNWIFSFLSGIVLIFITVLLFYRKIGLALISLLPGLISMIISFGFISISGISVDTFSIIFAAIITGLVIDYSIHTLVALNQIRTVSSLDEGFAAVVGYSGVPIFLSFSTSLFSFIILLFSSFRGARILALLLITSLVLSFFLSLYLLPLIILPGKKNKKTKKEYSHA
jgi:hypothetical protein